MKTVLQLWILILIIKLALAATLPLFADEAYYWTWSHHLQLSYFDHPGFISWLIFLGRPLESLGYLVRWPAVILGHASILFWVAWLRPNLREEQLKNFVILMSIAPLTGLGTLILTPDLPLMFFWSAAIYFSIRALETKSLTWYAFLGVALGLGFCSKYHMVLYIPFVLVWLTFSRQWSRVSWPGLGLTFGLGFIFSLPVLIWNLENEFISFLFQYQHGLVREHFKIGWPLEYLWQQTFLLFPPLLWGIWRIRQEPRLGSLWYLAAVPLFFFFAASFRGPSEANWPSIAYPAVFALSTLTPTAIWRRVFIGFWLVLTGLLISQIYHPWLPEPAVARVSQEPEKFKRLSEMLRPYSPLLAESYQSAAQLSFYSGRQIHKLRGLNRFDQYDLYAQSLTEASEFYLLISRPDMEAELVKLGLYQIVSQELLFENYRLLKVVKK